MKKRQAVFALAVIGLLGFLVLPGCSRENPVEDERLERALFLEMDQSVIVPTSVVRIGLGGTERMEAEEARLLIKGNIEGRSVSEEFSVPTKRDGDVGDLFIDLVVAEGLWSRFAPGERALFQGEITVRLRDSLGTPAVGRLERVNWRFVRELAPSLTVSSPTALFANATLEVVGDGVLRPREGQTWAVVETGDMTFDSGAAVVLTGARLPVEWVGERERGALRLNPAVIGVHPGQLSLSIRFENEFSDGTSLAGSGAAQQVESRLESTFIASLSPEGASRGQLFEIHGRGFVDGGESQNVGMILRLEGTFVPRDPTRSPVSLEGSAALERTPHEVVSDDLIRQEVWYRVVERRLEGLGATPGTFTGSITPIVFDRHGESQGLGWSGTFEILPTKQMIYIKYLPAFTVALDRYGLVNVEREIRDRILEVVHRDYGGLNIEFVEKPPANFLSYTTVEIGGPDPADGYAFGYDNTFNDQPKDTGNLYIDNYLGGINWQAGQEWNNPFGGIFVESFAFFSPTLHPQNNFASEHFDRVFGPFMPELGGTRVRATEWPEGSRAGQIAEAIRVFGNVVGNTLSHEVGHVLGLAHFPEDWESPGFFYHNYEYSGCIMDAGADRSFEQRAELNGEGPAVFNERNRAYLEQILPRPH